jgi:hypothetical protein
LVHLIVIWRGLRAMLPVRRSTALPPMALFLTKRDLRSIGIRPCWKLRIAALLMSQWHQKQALFLEKLMARMG